MTRFICMHVVKLSSLNTPLHHGLALPCPDQYDITPSTRSFSALKRTPTAVLSRFVSTNSICCLCQEHSWST